MNECPCQNDGTAPCCAFEQPRTEDFNGDCCVHHTNSEGNLNPWNTRRCVGCDGFSWEDPGELPLQTAGVEW